MTTKARTGPFVILHVRVGDLVHVTQCRATEGYKPGDPLGSCRTACSGWAVFSVGGIVVVDEPIDCLACLLEVP